MATITQAAQAISAYNELQQITQGLANLSAMAAANVTTVDLIVWVPGYSPDPNSSKSGAQITIPVSVAQATTFLTNRQTALQNALTGLGFTG